jgi:hypothetical protein
MYLFIVSLLVFQVLKSISFFTPYTATTERRAPTPRSRVELSSKFEVDVNRLNAGYQARRDRNSIVS